MEFNVDLIQIGKDLAHMGAEEQAIIFNTLGMEWNIAMRERHRAETQMCYLSDELTVHGMRFIKELYEFIKLREKAKEEIEEGSG